MYNSANFVVFVNFENYFSEIKKIVEFYKSDKITFFSGYDCDSLALDGITNFVNVTLNNFKNIPTAIIELRTKSVAIENLLSPNSENYIAKDIKNVLPKTSDLGSIVQSIAEETNQSEVPPRLEGETALEYEKRTMR